MINPEDFGPFGLSYILVRFVARWVWNAFLIIVVAPAIGGFIYGVSLVLDSNFLHQSNNPTNAWEDQDRLFAVKAPILFTAAVTSGLVHVPTGWIAEGRAVVCGDLEFPPNFDKPCFPDYEKQHREREEHRAQEAKAAQAEADHKALLRQVQKIEDDRNVAYSQRYSGLSEVNRQKFADKTHHLRQLKEVELGLRKPENMLLPPSLNCEEFFKENSESNDEYCKRVLEAYKWKSRR